MVVSIVMGLNRIMYKHTCNKAVIEWLYKTCILYNRTLSTVKIPSVDTGIADGDLHTGTDDYCFGAFQTGSVWDRELEEISLIEFVRFIKYNRIK